MNASLDLTPVLNRHFLKNIGKKIDALAFLFKDLWYVQFDL